MICVPHFESSDHPPPTRTITVCERSMRQKQSLGSAPPIQYFPLLSFHVSATTSTFMSTGRLLTTSPTATSSLFFGSATYRCFLLPVFLSGVDGRGKEPNDCLGVLDHVPRDEVDTVGLPTRGESSTVLDVLLFDSPGIA